MEAFSVSAALLIMTLIKDIKLVVTGETQFDNRDESFLTTTF